MPQKGQIIRHEWGGVRGINSPDTGYSFCDACKCKKKFEYGQWYYTPINKSDWQIQEPECITRPINEPNHDKETM
jgi:hypothetical protein